LDKRGEYVCELGGLGGEREYARENKKLGNGGEYVCE